MSDIPLPPRGPPPPPPEFSLAIALQRKAYAEILTRFTQDSTSWFDELGRVFEEGKRLDTQNGNLQIELHEAKEKVATCNATISSLRNQMASTQTAANYGNSYAKIIEIPDPEVFSGDPKKLAPFLQAMSVKLLSNASFFPTEQLRMAYFISRLSDKAHGQVKAYILPSGAINFPSVEEITKLLTVCFGDVDEKNTAAKQILVCGQGHRSFSDYVLVWSELAGMVDWNDAAKISVLKQHLHPALKTRMSFVPAHEISNTHDGFITQVRVADANLRSVDPTYFKKQNSSHSFSTSAPANPTPAHEPADDPMDLSGAKLGGTKRSQVKWSTSDPLMMGPFTEESRPARKEWMESHNRCVWCTAQDAHTTNSCPKAPWNRKENKGKA